MTCIVGLVQDGVAWLGADALASYDDHVVHTIARSKIVRRGGLLVATAGSGRFGDLLRHRVEWPAPSEDEDAEVFMMRVVDALRDVLGDHGSRVSAPEHREDRTSGVALIAHGGHLFVFDDDLSIVAHAEGYAAAGAGRGVALGALHATAGRPAEERVRAALAAAAAHSAWVRGPFDVRCTGGATPCP